MAQEAGAAIYTQLVASGVNGGTRIYQNIAETGAAYPYITITLLASADRNEDAVMIREELWAVHAWSTASAAQAGSISETIMDSLHRSSMSIAGTRWGLVGIESNEQVVFEESVKDERQFVQGGIYRVRLYQKF